MLDNGTVTLEIPKSSLGVGTHTVSAVYQGDLNHNASDVASMDIVVILAPTEMEIETEDAVYGETAYVMVSYLPKDATGTVTLTIGNKTFTEEVEDGMALIEITDLAADEYFFEVTYSGDKIYNATSEIASIEIIPASSEVVIDEIADVTYNASVEVTYTVLNETEITVTVYDADDNEITEGITVEDGKVIISGLDAGKYSIVIDNDDGENHTGSFAMAKFNVLKAVADIESESTGEFVVDGEVNVTFTVPEDIDGILTVTVDGEEVLEYTIEDGKITIPGNYAAGEHTVTVTLTGDTNYEDESASEIFYIVKLVPVVNADDLEFVVDNEGILEITGPAYGNLVVSIDGVDYAVSLDETGDATLDVSVLAEGSYMVDIAYIEDDMYEAAVFEDAATITVLAKNDTPITVKDVSIEVGETATVRAVVPAAINGQKVTISVNGKDQKVTVKNGKASAKFADLTAGQYEITVSYAGDSLNAANSTTATLTVSKVYPDTSIDVDDVVAGNDVTITVTVPDDAEGIVLFDVDGKNYYAPVEDGEATLILSDLAVGNYTVIATYTGDDKYYNGIQVDEFTVSANDTYNIKAESGAIQVGDDATVDVLLPEDATGTVTVSVDGKEYTAPVVNGKATVSVPGLGAGDYTADVAYSGDDKYAPSSTTAPISVDKVPDAPIDAEAEPTEVGEDAVVEVTLPDDATGTVTVTVDGKNYTAPVKDGKATVKVPNLPAGDYTADVAYSGDDKYDPVSTTAPISVDKVSDVPIDAEAKPIEAGEVAVVEVTLPDDATGTVTVTVKGKDYTAPVKDGKASVKVPGLTVGDYVAEVDYSGDNKYEPASTLAPITVDKVSDVPIDAEAEPVEVGEDAVVEVTLPKDATGTVTVSVGGKNYTAPVKDGKATVTVPDLGAGEHVADVTYSGDDKYKPASDTIPVVVDKVSDAPINATADPIDAGETATIDVTLPEDATGIVVADVDGKLYTAKIENGTATIEVPDLAPGKHTATVTYQGDDKYAPVNATVDIDVADVFEVIAPDVVKYYHGSERFYVYVLLNGEGIADREVSITLNGVTYKRTTNDEGIASIALNLNSGNYNVTVKAGNVSVVSSVTVKPTISSNDVTKVFRNGTQYYATFYDTEGNLLANKIVTFNINGVFYNRTTDANGVGKLNINLNPGEYIITAYNPVSGEMASNNITVLTHFVEHDDLDKVYRTPAPYTVTLRTDDGKIAGAGEVVTFNINGVFYNRTTDASGVAKLNINLMPGEYIITAYYKNEAVSNKITVREA